MLRVSTADGETLSSEIVLRAEKALADGGEQENCKKTGVAKAREIRSVERALVAAKKGQKECEREESSLIKLKALRPV